MIITSGFTTTNLIEGDVLRGNIYYDPKINTLTLDNVIITDFITFLEVGTIILIGENTIMGLKSLQYLTIKGKGTLCVEGRVQAIRLSVIDCTLYLKSNVKSLFDKTSIWSIKVESANVIIDSYDRLAEVDNIKLQGSSVVYQSQHNNYSTIIIQKDREIW